MRDSYKLHGATVHLNIEVEKEVAEKLKEMSDFTKYGQNELINVALKRFYSSHKDFFPQDKKHG